MQWAQYREEMQAWKAKAGQKGVNPGPQPKSPDELKNMQPVEFSEKKSDIAPDIQDML